MNFFYYQYLCSEIIENKVKIFIIFRVMVMKTHDQHFIENNSVENGPLTYTICGTATDKQIKPVLFLILHWL